MPAQAMPAPVAGGGMRGVRGVVPRVVSRSCGRSTAAAGDYAGQAAKAFENMKTALSDAGARVEDVISTRVLVASGRREDLVAAWEVVTERPAPLSRPWPAGI